MERQVLTRDVLAAGDATRGFAMRTFSGNAWRCALSDEAAAAAVDSVGWWDGPFVFFHAEFRAESEGEGVVVLIGA